MFGGHKRDFINGDLLCELLEAFEENCFASGVLDQWPLGYVV
jgi:hypothetical protein